MRYNLLYLLLAFSPALFGQPVPVNCNNAPLFIYSDSNNISRLNTIDIDQNAGTATLSPFPNTSGLSVNGIGYRLQDKLIYGALGNRLVQIDGTGHGVSLAPISGSSYAGDVTPDGKQLILANLQSLTTVNLESGAYEINHIPYTYKKPVFFFNTIDIAFNPSTGILYGFDSGGRRLVTIDPVTGYVDNTKFPVVDITKGNPALFFDAYGNLWGFSDYFLYEISTVTGKIEAKIPLDIKTSGRIDGCSCPAAFNFQKTAWPNIISHCGELEYIFSISNRTGLTQQGIVLEDFMPAGVVIEEIVKNPYGGQVTNAIGTNHILATNLSIPEGIDSFIVRVKVDDMPTGIYKNQATIKNISINAAPPEDWVSDNPATHAPLDSTAFFVKNLEETFETEEKFICNGSVVTLDAFVSGAQSYAWDSGEKTSAIDISVAGDYVATIMTECETATKTFHVVDASLTLDAGGDLIIQTGDTVTITPQWTGIGPLDTTLWSTSDPLRSYTCKSCMVTGLFPINDTHYTLQISNEEGCKASDEIEIEVQRSIYVPNVFAPSGTPPNNVFYIQSKNPVNMTYFKVFDRWGELVFERKNAYTADISAGWDGTMNHRKMPPGVYVWIAELQYANGSKEKMQGDVTLVE